MIIRCFPEVHHDENHETAHGYHKTKNDHEMHGQLADQRPQNEITSDGGGH
jgi:hypothetical protein